MAERKRLMMDSIELFSGTGGLALGLQMSGFNHTALREDRGQKTYSRSQNPRNSLTLKSVKKKRKFCA